MKTLLLRNTQLVDGTGAPARMADVWVRGDRIAAIDASFLSSPEGLALFDGLQCQAGTAVDQIFGDEK